MGSDILLHPDNVRHRATAGYLALRHNRHNGDQCRGAEGLGDHNHVPELRSWTGHRVDSYY